MAPDDLVQKLKDHAALIRKMDAIANADSTIQTNEATAALLDIAARVITLYRARYPDSSLTPGSLTYSMLATWRPSN